MTHSFTSMKLPQLQSRHFALIALIGVSFFAITMPFLGLRPIATYGFICFLLSLVHLTTLSALYLQCACFRTLFCVLLQTVPHKAVCRNTGSSCMDSSQGLFPAAVCSHIFGTCIAACLFRFRISSSLVAFNHSLSGSVSIRSQSNPVRSAVFRLRPSNSIHLLHHYRGNIR